jgi:hypothetical protein
MGLTNWFITLQVKGFVKGCYRAMLSSALAFKDQDGGTAPNYADYARKAMTTRPRWHMVSNDVTSYVFEKGRTITITDDMSVFDVIKLVVAIELEEIVEGLEPQKRLELFDVANNVLEKIQNQK